MKVVTRLTFLGGAFYSIHMPPPITSMLNASAEIGIDRAPR